MMLIPKLIACNFGKVKVKSQRCVMVIGYGFGILQSLFVPMKRYNSLQVYVIFF